MMDKMAGVFLDEANDLLDKLEDLLLYLEDHPDDPETISAVFRTMHTIKGSSAMFGFDEVSRFTHKAESAFDAVRNGIVEVSPDLITLTLRTRDHIRNMLEGEDTEELRAESEQLIAEFTKYIGEHSLKKAEEVEEITLAPPEEAAAPAPAAPAEADRHLMERTYRIAFTPSPDIFLNGTRPHSLIEELATLGKLSVTAFISTIPPLSDIDPTRCYVYWEAILTTTESVDAIKDVFIFLDDTNKIDITLVTTEEDILTSKPKRVGEILIEKDVATKEQIASSLGEQKPIGEILTESGVVSQEELQSALKEQQHMKELREAQSRKMQEHDMQTIKVSSEKLDRLIDLVGELVTFNARLSQVSTALLDSSLSTLTEQGERLILELRDTTMDMRMLPIGTIFSRFKRLVRDLAGGLKKNVELITEGAETELDKTVIEKLNDPLVHLIRNSVDHGIEMPDVRKAAGKTEVGTVLLRAQHAGTFVLITIQDDGAGLDREKILKKAIEKNLVSPDHQLTDDEVCDLIFMPGFSTSEKVTEISGRGVGMDVVKKDIEALGGSVSTKSVSGAGTTFTLKLPLTLAIIEGILVKIGRYFFVIPLANVVECLEFERQNDKLCSSVNIRNKVLPYIDLRTFFGITDPVPSKEHIIIVTDQDSQIGLIIDKTIGNYQTVIKPLGKLYKHADGFSGATILGDGSVALILDVYKLSDIVRKLDQSKG